MPKGLDTMLVDEFDGVIVTNDGATILDNMEVRHPAARMLANLAKSQEASVGDGTTTAVLLSSSIVLEGVEHILKGVPPSKLVEGIADASAVALQAMIGASRYVHGVDDPRLMAVALVASRHDKGIAGIAVDAAKAVGETTLREPSYNLAEYVLPSEVDAAKMQLIEGIVVDRLPLRPDMPQSLSECLVLVIDDALEADRIPSEAIATPSGYQRYESAAAQHRLLVENIIASGIKLVVADRAISEEAGGMMADAGVIALRRVAHRDLVRIAKCTGSRMVTMSMLRSADAERLSELAGFTESVAVDVQAKQTVIITGLVNSPAVTIVISGGTGVTLEERTRVAKDAVSAVQAAVIDGWVPGGGAVELAVSRQLAVLRNEVRGLGAYGWDCLIAALRKPLFQMAINAGFSGLEKVEIAKAAQEKAQSDALSIEWDSGEVADMTVIGILDPVRVKIAALSRAVEVGCSILRVSNIVRKRERTPSVDDSIPDRFA